jgi:predicted O-methyltransferase YrrM
MRECISKVLDRLEKQSNLEKTRKVNVPQKDRMLAITKETGELLNIILRLRDAKNILEIGTSTGYSTIWCAEAIYERSGKIITIENNPDKIKRASENFQNAQISDIITIKEGNAIDILNELKIDEKNNEFFDFVLIDADKENITQYFDLILPMVTIGGIIVTDNMLYPEKYRQEMEKFSNYLKTNPSVRTTTMSIGNGEEITFKIK